MDILLVISRLLDYPSESLCQAQEELNQVVQQAPLDISLRDRLQKFVASYLAKDILDWQAEYDGLFERGRSLGLWLFEHVHGESRDRGQAMVDLLNQYRQAGLEISQHELPDYLPLFLEFVATQGDENAPAWLQDVEHILALLYSRLEKRGSEYQVLFEVLLDLANSEVNVEEVRQQVDAEQRDDTSEALDKEWQEEEVTFGAESIQSGCNSNRRPSASQRADLEVPVHWVDFQTTDKTVARKSERSSS